MLRRQVERYGRWVAAIAILIVVSVICGGWILVNQRFPTPFDNAYDIKAEFADAPGLTPGLGQPVNVSGVRVGTISGRTLQDGRALVTLRIERGKLATVHADAHAALVPNTPLNDLQVELAPGSRTAPPLGHDAIIPVARTTPPPNVDEITHALDADTRAYFQALLSGFDQGTKGRADDLRALLRQLGPTSQQLRQVGDALAARRRALQRLVHNLSVLSVAAGTRDRDLIRAVRAGGQVLNAVAAPEDALRNAISRLPGTLDAADRSLASVRRLADAAGPAAQALLPAARDAPAALRAASQLSATAQPVLHRDVAPLVSRLQPVARDLAPASVNLHDVTPALTSAFQVLTYVVNEAAYNPPGPRDEGFLFWTSWFLHNVNSFVSVADAHGSVWRGFLELDCTSLTRQAQVKQVLGFLFRPLGC